MATTRAEEMRGKRPVTDILATFDPNAAINGLEPIIQAGNKLLENWMTVGSEILEFGRTRIDRSLEISKAMARSNSLDEAIDLHADFTRAMVRDYFNEAGKIADLSTRAMIDSLWAWQPATRGETAQRRSNA